MGVFRLFNYFINRYPKFYRTVNNNDSSHYCDAFLLDLNAIFHPIAKEIYSNSQNGKVRLLDNVNKNLSSSKLEEKVFKAICDKVVQLTHLANPNKILYLAIDGVAGLSKQAQQRKRRFQNITDTENGEFDFKNITAGTQWMERLCTYIFKFFDSIHQTDPFFTKLEIIYNDMHVPGEGEHKIIRWMDLDNKCKSYSVFSPDADLIMLTMGLSKRNIFIIRDNVYDYIQGEVIIVNVDKLKSFILDDIKWVSVDHPYDENRIIKDYIFFLILIGNDFLPPVPSVDTKTIDKIQTTYVTTAVDVGYLLTSQNTLNVKALAGFMNALAKIEPDLLLLKLSLRVVQPDTVLVNNTIRTEAAPRINMDGYVTDYYTRNFEDVSVGTVCDEYLKGMFFIIQYYLNSIPTYDWVYPFHYAPLFTNIAEYLNLHPNLNYSFIYRPPLKLLESLASVLHPKSFYLLPPKVADFLTLRKDFDPDFSESFTIDYEGKQNDYEGIPHINTVSYDKIKGLLKEFKLRDSVGPIQIIKPKFVKGIKTERKPFVKQFDKPIDRKPFVKQFDKPVDRKPFVKPVIVDKKDEPVQEVDEDDIVTFTF
jgi:5'-3' exonuclease